MALQTALLNLSLSGEVWGMDTVVLIGYLPLCCSYSHQKLSHIIPGSNTHKTRAEARVLCFEFGEYYQLGAKEPAPQVVPPRAAVALCRRGPHNSLLFSIAPAVLRRGADCWRKLYPRWPDRDRERR